MSESVDYKKKNLNVLRADVDETKNILTVTVDKLVERGDRLDALAAKADDLNTSSVHFHGSARRVSRKMKWQNRKVSICIAALVIIVVAVIVIVIVVETKKK